MRVMLLLSVLLCGCNPVVVTQIAEGDCEPTSPTSTDVTCKGPARLYIRVVSTMAKVVFTRPEITKK